MNETDEIVFELKEISPLDDTELNYMSGDSNASIETSDSSLENSCTKPSNIVCTTSFEITASVKVSGQETDLLVTSATENATPINSSSTSFPVSSTSFQEPFTPSDSFENKEERIIKKFPLATSTPIRQVKSSNSHQPWSPKTKLAKAVSVVLGKTSEVEELDRIREKYKINPHSKVIEEKYLDCLATTQASVMKAVHQATTKFKLWSSGHVTSERNFLVSPSNQDILDNPEASKLMRIIKYGKGLAKEWKIDI